MSNELIREPVTLEALVKRSSYTQRFQEVLGLKAPGFMSSLIAVGRSMPDVDPKSIIGAAMTAAVLDLPIDRSLGFAWIVPYREGDRKFAQFQIGYKGFVQLAQRSGCYRRMNARAVNKEAFDGYDDVGEPRINWEAIDPEKEPSGYVFAFQLTNGFSKVCYWSRKRVEAHAKKYSQAFRKGSGPWKDNFNEMAIKTVIKNELSDWGILSIEFRRGLETDQAVIASPEAVPEFPDNLLPLGDSEPVPTPEPEKKPEPKPAPTPPPPQGVPAPTEQESASALLEHFVTKECGQSFTVFQKWAQNTGMIPDADALGSFSDIPDRICKRLLNAKAGLAQGLTETVLGR